VEEAINEDNSVVSLSQVTAVLYLVMGLLLVIVWCGCSGGTIGTL